MKLILTGCEYAGKRTLGREIWRWWAEQTGGEILPPPETGFHDHFTVPNVVHATGHEDHKEESEKNILKMNPGLLEHFQRFQIEYHLGHGFVNEPDHWLIDFYYADAVFAPLYYGYGRPGEYADRREARKNWDNVVMEFMPDAILVLLKASPDVIRKRFREVEHHPKTLFKEEDIEYVLDRFQEEFDNSRIHQRFAINTSESTVEESLAEFIDKVDPYIIAADRARMELGKGEQKL